MTQEYIRRLVSAYPSIREVWLFGSRANNRAQPNSDWDYLVFGDDDSLLNSLHLDSQFNEVGVDLFIVASPTIAMKPWFDDRHRILGLDHLDLDWRAISETEAHYREKVKAAAPSDPPQYRPANAVLAYRRDP